MTPRPGGSTRIACVGASITFGLGLKNRRAECYPAVLAQLLDESGLPGESGPPGESGLPGESGPPGESGLLGDEVRVRNFGYSGAAAGRGANEPYWRTPSFTAATRFDPHVAVLAFGANDAQRQNLPHLDRFDRDLADLVEHFRSLPSCSSVVLTLPLPVFPPQDEIDIETLDRVVRPNVQEVGAALGLPVIDTHTPFLDKQAWFPDNLHPTAEGARLLAELVHAGLREHGLAG